MTKIKLCGMQNEAHIEWANEAGCDYIGFVFAPSRRQISREVEGIIDLIQLHGGEDEACLLALRSLCQLPIIKAVSSPRNAEKASTSADYILLDGATGGSGKVFDWNQAHGYDKPLFLAGGLHAGNLEKAIKTVGPYAVDLSSGLEEHGEKQRHLMLQATAIAHAL